MFYLKIIHFKYDRTIIAKKIVKYKSSIIHHYASDNQWNTTKENRSVINALINNTINKSILSSNDCSIIITNQKLIRNPNTTIVIEPMLQLEQYLITPKINDKYKNNIFNYNDILSHSNDNEKIEKINKKIYELYQNKIHKYLLSDYLNYINFCEKYMEDEYNIKLFIINGSVEDIMILTKDSSPIIVFYTTNKIKSSEWFSEHNNCIVVKQMENCELINNSDNHILINIFNIYIHNIFIKTIHYNNFALIIY